MKKLAFIFLVVASLAAHAQQDTLNYLLVYRKPEWYIIGDANAGGTLYAASFRTQAQMVTYLNEQLDSTYTVVGAYDVRTKKPLKVSSTVEVVERTVVEKQRRRRWDVKT
jgi:hypothetical protein